MIDEWNRGAKYWTRQFNPVIGCSPISEGCKNCWAKGFAERLKMTDDFSCRKLTGAKAPKSGIVFVGNMSDIFKEWNSYLEITDWLSMLSDKAINLILTKRAEPLQEIYLPNFQNNWFGITAENQARLEERAPHLIFSGPLQKWISCEPLLGEMNITPFIGGQAYLCKCGWHETEHGLRTTGWNPSTKQWDSVYCYECRTFAKHGKAIQWVVVGAESGPDSVRRPCKLEWVESIVEQCQSANVPVFVKQINLNGKLVKDISKFPPNLQIRQVPWKGEKV